MGLGNLNPGCNNCGCIPRCDLQYEILEKTMWDWRIANPAHGGSGGLVWKIRVNGFTEWRIWVSTAIPGYRVLYNSGNVNKHLDPYDYDFIFGPPNAGSVGPGFDPSFRRKLFELELKTGLGGNCEWVKIDECWVTYPELKIFNEPCIENYLPDSLGSGCIFAGSISTVQLPFPAHSVTIAGYPSPYNGVNGTFTANSSYSIDVIDVGGNYDYYWPKNYYGRRTQHYCTSVSGVVESQHYTNSYPGYPAASAYYWKRKAAYWNTVYRQGLIINRFECIPCDPDKIAPTGYISGTTLTKVVDISSGGRSGNASWYPPPAHPLDPSGTVELNF